MSGTFVTLEGIEGAGKSTLARGLAEALRARGLEAVVTREPGGTPLAENVRRLVLERGPEHVSPVAETLLMFASRAVHLDNLVRPALRRGAWVICDRFTDATRAYQGHGRGLPAEFIESLASAVHAGLEPQVTLWLDLPVAEGLARSAARAARGGADAQRDRFEAETLAFFGRVRDGYAAIAAREPQRVHRLDARQTPEALLEAALASLAPWLERRA